jgi:hypothetical protein
VINKYGSNVPCLLCRLASCQTGLLECYTPDARDEISNYFSHAGGRVYHDRF